MKPFLDEDFLLTTETSRALYRGYAERTPIIDYHCHINAIDIAEDLVYENVTRAALAGDHYKWRLMRANGTPEDLITGGGGDAEKFYAYARALERAPGNPLYHWTHLELKRFFGYDGALNSRTAPEVYSLCNNVLGGLSVRQMIRKAGVEVICTTDDPTDGLEHHLAIANDPSFDTRVFPAFRPDKALYAERAGFAEYVGKLSGVSGIKVDSFEDLCAALKERLDHFAGMGCVATDHGLDKITYAPSGPSEADRVLKKALRGEPVAKPEAEAYRHALLKHLSGEYARRGWVMEIHYGANRSVNKKMFGSLGPDTGFDAIGETGCGGDLALFLNDLNESGSLPKTLIFSLNPNDDLMINSVAGSFQSAGTPARVQQGSAWWYNDTKSGMLAQIAAFANTGAIGNFLGMLTDSRSFLSYVRHEYFRRIFCDFLGTLVENGEYPYDEEALGGVVRGVCYGNAKGFFGW